MGQAVRCDEHHQRTLGGEFAAGGAVSSFKTNVGLEPRNLKLETLKLGNFPYCLGAGIAVSGRLASCW